MVTEVLDIVDTTVKIGLGAVIGGVTTYYITKLKDTQEIAQDNRRRKLEFIANGLDAADAYIVALGNLLGSLDGLRLDNPKAETIDETGEKDFVEKYDGALQDTILQRNRAFSRLRISGQTIAAEQLNALHKLEDEIRVSVIFQGELPTTEKLESWFGLFKKARETFLNEISKTYQG